jgi:hypothetical protein
MGHTPCSGHGPALHTSSSAQGGLWALLCHPNQKPAEGAGVLRHGYDASQHPAPAGPVCAANGHRARRGLTGPHVYQPLHGMMMIAYA